MDSTLKIGDRLIGKGHPTFIIAEVSANHNMSYDRALQIIECAGAAGADAVKLQTYTPDTITIDCDNDPFQIKHGMLWDGQTLYQLYEQAYTPWAWHQGLKEAANKAGMVFFSSPFDPSSIDFLEQLAVPAYKIASPEINDIPLITYAAQKGKPILLSTGVATLGEIEAAIRACQKAGNNQIILFKCVSSYPTPLEDMNLRTIPHMAEAFQVLAGLSDHSLGHAAALGAVALGACVIEKHLTLDRSSGGPDAAFSMEPNEFAQMVQGIRDLEKALGTVCYRLSPEQLKSREHMRSLFAVADIPAGMPLTPQNVRSIRPDAGLAPHYIDQVLGRRANCAIHKGTPLSWDLIL